MTDKCYQCDEALGPLRLTWQPAFDQQPTLYMHAECARTLAVTLLQAVDVLAKRPGVLECRVCKTPVIDAQRVSKMYCSEACKDRAKRMRVLRAKAV
jgi:hypothetical protein